MCRAGLRHCKPTEAQKRAAAERRRKNRNLKKAVVNKLIEQGLVTVKYNSSIE